uniref:hypothetical protein n=1 Tax=Scandinavium goeteborgense TaxID=1851514 RepID=UPI001CA5B8A8|nr:hypothetical protein [Scandinavium goeteborgense]
MKAKEAKLLNFLQTAPQLIIPIYQRLYSWSLNECEQYPERKQQQIMKLITLVENSKSTFS